MARKLKAAIVGGGIGGLAAALALHRRGHEFDVYEQGDAITEIGGGLNLSPNALKAFRMLGVEEDAVAIGYQDDWQRIHSWRNGIVLAQQSRRDGVAQRYGAEFLTLHRADLQRILYQHLPAERVHTRKVCIETGNTANGAYLKFADGTSAEADLVVGADGIHSAVRDSLFGKTPPRFTGCICWRGMVPWDAVKHIPQMHELGAWWGPHGHVVHYRVRRGELVNFVAHYDSDAWLEESWTRECTKDELLNTFSGWHDALLQLFNQSDRYYKWALYDRDPIPQWSKGNITLLGDAVHPMLPYLGQGAAMALEDGCMLARLIDSDTSGDISTILASYEALRKPRGTRCQLGSRERAKEYHLPSTAARLWRDAKLAVRNRFGTDRTPLRAEWIYNYDVAFASLNP
jgi:salicylate hydroxylase